MSRLLIIGALLVALAAAGCKAEELREGAAGETQRLGFAGLPPDMQIQK